MSKKSKKSSNELKKRIGLVFIGILVAFGVVAYTQADAIDQMLNKRAFDRGIVTITWDDGFASQFKGAYPIHQKYSLPGTFYITSGFLDTDFYMTSDQVRILQQSGHEIGGHSMTHVDLTSLSAAELEKEVVNSQTDLKTKYNAPVNHLASPFGKHNDAVVAKVKQHYDSHRTVEKDFNYKDTFDVYDIKIQEVATNTKPEEIQAWVDQAKKDRLWLVLMYHQVDNPKDALSVSVSDLDKHFEIISKSEMPVLTMDEALKEILPQVTKK